MVVCVTPLRSCLPPAAVAALRLADDPAFAPWWLALDANLSALGERAANLDEARRMFAMGWTPEGGAWEITDRRASRDTTECKRCSCYVLIWMGKL